MSACRDELDTKEGQVVGFLAVRLTVSGGDGVVSNLEVRGWHKRCRSDAQRSETVSAFAGMSPILVQRIDSISAA